MKRWLVAGAVLLFSRTASAQCPPRPSDAAGYLGFTYGAETEQTVAGAAVRVHYVTAGTHAATAVDAQYVSDTAEDALARYAQMGFATPPGDESCGATNGGDGKLDIYLVKFAGADGSTVKTACTGKKCSSFMLVESTFKGRGYPTTNEGFRTVVVHELFHAVQNAYDAESEARFWQEGSAQWAMKSLHPELVDFENQLPAFFADPKRSIDFSGSGVSAGFLYGSAVWPLFLSLRHGDSIVKEIWEHQGDGEEAVPAIDAVLQTKSSSLADEFPLFWAWNVGTKDRTGTGGYPDAAKYPGVKATSIAELAEGATGITSGLSAFAFIGDLGGKMKVSLETDETRNSAVLVPLDGEKTQLDKAQKLPVVAEGRALVVVTGVTTKKTDAPFTLHVVPDDGTTSSSSSSSGGTGGGDDGGCSCSTPSSRANGAGASMCIFVLALLFARRGRARVQSTSHD